MAVDISVLESDPGVETVISGMLAGEDGEESLTASRVTPRGDVYREGVTVTSHNATYHYRKVLMLFSGWSK